jgi:hypothetical protein
MRFPSVDRFSPHVIASTFEQRLVTCPDLTEFVLIDTFWGHTHEDQFSVSSDSPRCYEIHATLSVVESDFPADSYSTTIMLRSSIVPMLKQYHGSVLRLHRSTILTLASASMRLTQEYAVITLNTTNAGSTIVLFRHSRSSTRTRVFLMFCGCRRELTKKF